MSESLSWAVHIVPPVIQLGHSWTRLATCKPPRRREKVKKATEFGSHGHQPTEEGCCNDGTRSAQKLAAPVRDEVAINSLNGVGCDSFIAHPGLRMRTMATCPGKS